MLLKLPPWWESQLPAISLLLCASLKNSLKLMRIASVILTNCLCGSLMYATVGRRWFTAFVKHTVSLIISVEFFCCSMQLQQHDSVHLSSAYTDYSFSSYGRPYVVIGRPYYFTPVISSFFLLSFFLQLFSAVADWMSTIHDVALVRI